MKSLISTFLIMSALAISPVRAADVDVKGGMASIEIYYQNTETNKEMFHDVGIQASAYLHDDCYKKSNCTAYRKGLGISGHYEDLNYSRFGILHLDATKGVSGANEKFNLNQASITVFEGEDKDGFRFHFVKVGYKKDHKLQYLDYRIPVELVGIGHEVVFNVASRGGRDVVQLFIKGDVALSAGYARTKHLQSKVVNEGQISFVKREGHNLDLAASYSASSGIRILNKFELSGISGGSVRTTMSDLTYGGKASFYLTDKGPFNKLHISGYLIKGTVYSNTLYDESFVNGAPANDQSFVQGGVGIGFKF